MTLKLEVVQVNHVSIEGPKYPDAPGNTTTEPLYLRLGMRYEQEFEGTHIYELVGILEVRRTVGEDVSVTHTLVWELTNDHDGPSEIWTIDASNFYDYDVDWITESTGI